MSKDRKQSVSHFTEEQLTPLEQKFAEAKANRDAGVEPYKIVPIELWEEAIKSLDWTLRYVTDLRYWEQREAKEKIVKALEKMKQL